MQALLFLLSLTVLSTDAAAPGPNGEAPAAIEAVVRSMFEAFAAEDEARYFALWTLSSPELAERRELFATVAAEAEAIAVKSLRFRRVRVEGDVAYVRVAVELTGTNVKTGGPSGHLGKLERKLELIREHGEWKVRSYGPFLLHDPGLLASVLAAESPQERQRVIAAEFDENRDTVLMYAFSFARDPARRRRLLREEPVLQRWQFAAMLNQTCGLAVETRGDGWEETALRVNDGAREVAEFIRNPEAEAWCVLYRGLIDEAAGRDEAALNRFEQAAATFEKLGYGLGGPQGEFAAQVRLGRLFARTGRGADAVASFARAKELRQELVLEPDNHYMLLGERYGLRLAERDRVQIAAERLVFSGGDLAEAAQRSDEMLRIEREVFGETSEDVYNSLGWIGALRLAAGDAAAARTASLEAAEVATRLYGDGHHLAAAARRQAAVAERLASLPEVDRDRFTEAIRVRWQARGLLRAGKPAEAIPLLDSVAEVLRELLGEDHLWYADALRLIGNAHENAGNLEDAERFYRQADRIQRGVVADDDWERIAVVTGLANVLFAQVQKLDLDDATRERTIAMLEEYVVLDRRHPAARLKNAAAASMLLDFGRRLRVLDEATRRRLLDARRLARDAVVGRPEAALQIEEALGVFDEHLGPDEPMRFVLLVRLGDALTHTGRAREALERFREAVEMADRGAALRADGVYGLGLVSLAEAEERTGDIASAEEHFRRGIVALEAGGFGDGDDCLKARLRLAYLARRVNDHMHALRQFWRLMRDYKRLMLPRDHAEYWTMSHLHEIAGDEVRNDPWLGDYLDAAVGFYAQAALTPGGEETVRRQLSETLPAFATRVYETDRTRWHVACAGLVGILDYIAGRYAEAKASLSRARELERELRGGDGPLDYGVTQYLAEAHFHLGEFAEAETLLLESIAVHEATLGPEGQMLAWAQSSLAVVYGATGRRPEAILLASRAAEARAREIDSAIAVASESEATELLDRAMRDESLLVSLIGFESATPEDVRLAWNGALQIKGRIVDLLRGYREARRLLRDDPAVAAQAARLAAARQEWADLSLASPLEPGHAALAAWAERLDTEIRSLEIELNRALRVKVRSAPPDIAAVLGRLPDGAALVDVHRLIVWNHAGGERPGDAEWHYIAFVARGGDEAQPRMVDLGLVDNVAAVIEPFLDHLAEAGRRLRGESEADLEVECREFGKDVYGRVFAPLEEAIGDATTVYVAPDGDLHRIPFAALSDRDGTFLVERYRFAYLSAASDLVRPPSEPASGTIVVAGPDFDLRPDIRVAEADALIAGLSRGGGPEPSAPEISSGPLPEEVRGGRSWNPLPGAVAEAAMIEEALEGTAFGPVRRFVGPEALEEVLKALAAPRILHVATHGFFLPDEPDDGGGEGLLDRGAPGAAIGLSRLRSVESRVGTTKRRPLLRSGLVFAGANALGDTAPGDTQAGRRAEDGWLTAEEVLNLDLTGTELVVLSACESGLGDVNYGDGVHGLRRAFLLAGARTLVTSQFKVPDAATHTLMVDFYAGLEAGRTKLEALHEAQTTMIERRRTEHGAAHPYFWAGFVLVGDPN